MIVQLLILAVLLTGGFYVSRFIFWLLFLKDAPALEEQENFYFDLDDQKSVA